MVNLFVRITKRRKVRNRRVYAAVKRFKVALQMKSGNRISEVAPPSPFEVL